MKIAMNILIAIIVLIIALSFILVYGNTHPPRYPLHIPPSDYGAAYESVSFVTEDGLTLRGWLVRPKSKGLPAPGIIICHGQGANRSDFTELAVHLSSRGYAVLAFDFRAHGESGGRRSSLGYHEQKDIKAASRFLTAHPGIDGSRIGIFGFSLGGAAAILTAAETGMFRAVAADSAFASLRDQARQAITGFYHLPAFPFFQLAVLGYELYFQTNINAIAPESAIGRISPVPVFIIAGEGDDLIPAENGRRLHRAAREPKELWIVPVAGHGYTVAAAGDEYYRRVGDFFDAHIK
jgi:dipeptidyl aminopeptidase/acylaminoacyl peptidase